MKFSHVDAVLWWKIPLFPWESTSVKIDKNRCIAEETFISFFALPNRRDLLPTVPSSFFRIRIGGGGGRKEEHPVSSIAHFLCRSENALWGKGTKVCAEIQYD